MEQTASYMHDHPQPSTVTIFAPATVANLGVGFDILGMALEAPGDEVTATRCPEPGIVLTALTGDGGQLSTDPDRNTAGIAAREVLKMLGVTSGVHLSLKKGLPLASGLGSSAASAAAAAAAVNLLFGAPLSLRDLLPACLEAEAAVSGRHADNVAPALLGGIVLLTGTSPGSIHQLPVPDGLYLSLVTPDVAVPTQQARALLPPTVTLQQAIHQNAYAATLVHALYTGDLRLLAHCMAQDTIATPARAALIPGLEQARQAAINAGAMTAIISGAGPTICALCDDKNIARQVSRAFAGVYAGLGISCQTIETRPGAVGTRVVTPIPE